jgi:hypothetical protein
MVRACGSFRGGGCRLWARKRVGQHEREPALAGSDHAVVAHLSLRQAPDLSQPAGCITKLRAQKL